MTQSTKTTCPYCGVGCGILVTAQTDGSYQATGDPSHPANFGRLCSKGAALCETLSLDGRLLEPMIAQQAVSWTQALDEVAARFQQIIAQHGSDAIAFYVSGQLLTEDYYVANKLLKGYLGTANIDTNSRLCMASSVAGYKRAFGSDTVPCDYTDLEQADLIVLVGSNTAWCHPVIYQRIKQAKRNRPKLKLVVIDPRSTTTCEIADLHLPISPGSDSLLFNGLLDYLRREDALDWEFLERHVEGFAPSFNAAKMSGGIPRIAAACGISEQDLAEFFQLFTRLEKSVTLYSQGVNQWSFGTDKVNAIINCYLATGRIGKPGMGPFSITGQPNAMGGREVGGLSNQLAAHMDFLPEHIDRVARFWQASQMAQQPGLKAIDMMQAVADGRIKALWVMATNPAVSMPNADQVQQILTQCELLVVSDMFADTDTARCADILLPACGWGEKDGTVTNSERRISRQRAFLQAPGQAKPDWWIISQVAKRLGFAEAFAYSSPADIFREHTALSAFENDGCRDFDLGELAHLDQEAYQSLEPYQWPSQQRLFADQRFFTDSGRARMVPIEPGSPANLPNDDYPFSLNTGRIRDQWHTMTRTARSPRLNKHLPEPFVTIHPSDAANLELIDGDLAQLTSQWGQMLARVHLDQGQRPGSVFVPFHWSNALAHQACANALVNPVTDPISGQPEFKHTPVDVKRWQPIWQGFALTREVIADPMTDYQVAIRTESAWRYEFASKDAIPDWGAWVRNLFGTTGEWLEYADPSRGNYRGALIRDGRLTASLFVSKQAQLPRSSWLNQLFEQTTLDSSSRASLLAGKPPVGAQDTGETICACFNVGIKTIETAIRDQHLTSVAAIGEALRAGTNCGSCLPEIEQILKNHRVT